MNTILPLSICFLLVMGQPASRESYEGTAGLPSPTLDQMVQEPEYKGELKITKFTAARDAEPVSLPGGLTCDPAFVKGLGEQLSRPRPVDVLLTAKGSTTGTMRLTIKPADDKDNIEPKPVDLEFEYDRETGHITVDTYVSVWHVTMDATAAYQTFAQRVALTNTYFVFLGKMTATAGENDAIRVDMLIRARSVKWMTLDQPLEVEGGTSLIIPEAAPKDPYEGLVPDSPVRRSEIVDSGVRISGITGQVDMYPPGGEDERRSVGLKTKIPIDWIVETGEDSRVILSFPDMTTFEMKPETKVIVDRPPGPESKLSLVAGKIWTNLKKMIKDGSMEVQMSQAVAGIKDGPRPRTGSRPRSSSSLVANSDPRVQKGTVLFSVQDAQPVSQFVCETTADESTVKVFVGQVSVTAKANGKVKRLKAGEMITVYPDGFGTKMLFDRDEEAAGWQSMGANE